MDIDYSIQYDKWHDGSDEHYAEMVDFYRRLLRPVLGRISRNAMILDVGCGTGLLVNTLLRLGFANVKGIDLSPQQIARARQRGLPCSEVASDGLIEMARDAPASVDTIFLMDVLEHIPIASQLEFVGALSELLVPDGLLVVSVPNANASFATRWVWNDWTHVCAFSEHSLEFVLRNRGFGPVEILPYEFGVAPSFPYLHQPSFWTGLLRRLFRAIRRLEAIAEFGRQGLSMSLSLNLLGVCRKQR